MTARDHAPSPGLSLATECLSVINLDTTVIFRLEMYFDLLRLL